MRKALTSLLVISLVTLLSACQFKTSGWKHLENHQIDQKSYAITYAGTVQTYEDRINDSYDIDSYIRGVDDFFNNKMTLPIEQIRGSLLNRMLDNDKYAYYSGVLDASSFRSKMHYLSESCWKLLDLPSATQGIYYALKDLQKGTVRMDDEYIKKGADEILHRCVQSVE